ncbi:MAG: exopolysaccharide biosynthesis WecB/TagA/CpsF family protein [Sediminicola sp.]
MLIKELNTRSAFVSSIFEQSDACRLYTFINSYSYLKLRHSNINASEFHGFYYDGLLMKIFMNIFFDKSINRISFDMTSLAPVVFDLSVKENKRVYFVGAKETEIVGFVGTIRVNYSELNIVGYRNGYFSGSQREDTLKEILNINPDIVVVGMGTPLQEGFLVDLKEKGWKGKGFTCGGFFHQTSKNLRYYPYWIDKFNLRWLYRLCDEPKLIRRFLRAYLIFPFVFTVDYYKLYFSK